MLNQKQAFTLVELIVVIIILAILGTIAFISLQGYSKSARDSRRVSDIANIKTSLELFILNSGFYPQPDVVGSGAVYYSGDLLWTQGTVGNNVTTNLSRNLPNKPLDPLFDIEYTYSLANSNKEYQLMAVYEGEVSSNNIINSSYAANAYKIKVEGTFNEIFIKTPNYIIPVPSIITSEETPFDLETENEKIESMVITNGTNFPTLNIPNTTVQTGGLIINLSLYTGTIDSKSSTGAMIAAINAIQGAYNGTNLATKDIYKNILSYTTDEQKISLVNYVVLNNTFSVKSNQDEEIPVVDLKGNDEFTKLLIHSNIDNSSLSFNDTFEGTELNTNLWKENVAAGDHNLSVSDGTVKFNCDSNDYIQMYSLAKLSGDFDIQVDFSNLSPKNPSSWWTTMEFRDLRSGAHYNTIQINRNQLGIQSKIWNNTVVSTTTTSSFPTTGKFRIVRTGNTAYIYIDQGSGWQLLKTGATDGTSIGQLYLYSGYAEVEFDNVFINNGNFVNYSKFNDESLLANNVITTFGDTNHSTTTSKFGATSMYFDGNGDYLSIPDSENFDFGTGNFTIDFWFKRVGTGGNMMGKDTDGTVDTESFTFSLISSAPRLRVTGSNNVSYNAQSSLIFDTNWHHIAGVRDGNILHLYVDGVEEATQDLIGVSLRTTTAPLLVGAYSTNNVGGVNGYIDEVRISKGIARWTTNFSTELPTAPYGN